MSLMFQVTVGIVLRTEGQGRRSNTSQDVTTVTQTRDNGGVNMKIVRMGWKI